MSSQRPINRHNPSSAEVLPSAQAAQTAPAPLFACVTIIGVGMMGGALGLALRAQNVAGTIVGVDTREETLARAREIGAIDAGTMDLQAGVQAADCVILAAPVGVMQSLLESLAPFARADALITDIGSVKRAIVETGERLFGTRFVGGHPMAGSPLGGIYAVKAVHANLFVGASWAIVRGRPPDLEQDAWARKLDALVRRLGSRPLLLDSAQHDRLAALVSHLPHLLAFAFADTIAGQPDAEAARDMAGGSYRDLMRVAQADRAFWQDIFAQNRDALQHALAEYETRLRCLKQMLEG